MGHFVRHWPADLIEDVENAVRERVSQSNLVGSYTELKPLHPQVC